MDEHEGPSAPAHHGSDRLLGDRRRAHRAQPRTGARGQFEPVAARRHDARRGLVVLVLAIRGWSSSALSRTLGGSVGRGRSPSPSTPPAVAVIGSEVVGHTYHDDHNSPSILIEPDSRLTIFWSGHNGAQMDERTSTAPAEITSWEPKQTVPVHLLHHRSLWRASGRWITRLSDGPISPKQADLV